MGKFNKSNTFAVRLALDKDFEEIFEIWLQGIANSFNIENLDLINIESKFKYNFNNRESIFNYWVIENDKLNLIGWLSLSRTTMNPLKLNKFAEMSIYIHKDFRHNDLGDLLFSKVIEDIAKSDLEYLSGFISASNETSRKIAKATGWYEIGELPLSNKSSNQIKKIFVVYPL